MAVENRAKAALGDSLLTQKRSRFFRDDEAPFRADGQIGCNSDAGPLGRSTPLFLYGELREPIGHLSDQT